MPSTPQGESPAEKFLGRRTCMSFELTSVSLDGAMNADAHADSRTYTHLHAGMHGLDANSHVTITAKRGSGLVSCGSSSVKQINLSWLRPLFHMSERVLIKASPVLKVSSPYCGPYMVEEVLSRYTFRLSDGQCWSARAMKRWEPWMDDAENVEMQDEGDREQTLDGTDRGHMEALASPGSPLPR